MKRLFLVGLLCSCATAVWADDGSKWSVRGEAGVLGYGIGVTTQVTPEISVTAGYNGGDYSRNVTLEGDRYEMHLKNNNLYVNAEYRPFAKWQYFTAGVSYFNPNYYGDRHFAKGENFKLRGRSFRAEEDVNVRGTVDYATKISPYLGTGVSAKIHKNVSLFAEVGVYYVGSAKVDVQADNVENISTGGKRISLKNPNSVQYRYYQEAIERVKESIHDEAPKRWIPQAKVGVAVHF